MIIRIIATALIQCMILTQAGWITFAGTRIACSSVAARLDTAVLRHSNPSLSYTIRREMGVVTGRVLSNRCLHVMAVQKRGAGVFPGPAVFASSGRARSRGWGGGARCYDAGISTVSTTWMTPLD